MFLNSPAVSQTEYPGCCEALRLALSRRGTPELALNSTIATHKNTIAQYNVTFKIWWSFCKGNNLNTFTYSLHSVLLFMAEQFNKGSAYDTINSHCSALSLLLGGEVGADEQIKRLLRGVYKSRPSAPKYVRTWDPKTVDHFSNLDTNKKITLEKLTKKVVVLLTLCTGHRVTNTICHKEKKHNPVFKRN